MSATRSGGRGEQPASCPWSAEMRLDGFPGELGHSGAATFGFVAQSGIKVVGQLHRRALHVCQHTAPDSAAGRCRRALA